ncbi:MAG: ATP-binding protein, partial [Peptococcaceae bacterium]|nr:ATP-binding protein [Peptococcaceae bacterium]
MVLSYCLQKNISQFYPNCRIRFIRYDGNYAGVGTNINIIKDKNIEACLPNIIVEAKAFIASQLREFTALDQMNGRFQVVPEYPEFAWLEGIVNAVTHREYALTGCYITVAMYDDRLEIISPGKFPSFVTVENIRETRFSRNPRISRVLTEFGWVRELNEGVKRIYAEMEAFFLEDPVYSETYQDVKLVLKNNMVMRTMRQIDRTKNLFGVECWNDLDDLERHILTYMGSKKRVTRSELATYTGKSDRTVTTRLNRLMAQNVIRRNGGKNDPHQTYEIIF